jgi:hypothetical protein
MMISPRAAGAFLALLIALAAMPATYAQSPVAFSFKTYPDTLGTGVSNHKIEFYVDGNGHEIATLIFGLELQFADSNLFGPIPFIQERVRDASGAFRSELQEWDDA